MTAEQGTGLVAGPEDPRWVALRAPFPDGVLEWKPQPVKKANRDEKRNMRGRCRKNVTDPDGHAISADDYYCGGYHARSVHLAYVGHAELTVRLNDVCSPAGWDWEPVAVDSRGWPLIENGGMWIRLTVLGVTKLGFGDMGDNTGANGVKECIGDAMRNAAIRFGIATYLWSKSERSAAMKYADAAEVEAVSPPPQQERRQQERPPERQQQATPMSGTAEARQTLVDKGLPDDELTLAKRRHREAIARAHPEWDADAKGAAITNAFAAERRDHNGQPTTLQTATPADWSWLATYWEDEAEERAQQQAEHDAAIAAEAEEDAAAEPAQPQPEAVPA